LNIFFLRAEGFHLIMCSFVLPLGRPMNRCLPPSEHGDGSPMEVDRAYISPTPASRSPGPTCVPFMSIACGLKCILDELNSWCLSIELDRHDIETAKLIGFALLREIDLRRLDQVALLFACHRGSRWTKRLRATGFHLNKGQGAAVSCNQIDFPKPAAVVTLQNVVALLAEVLDRCFLPCSADCVMMLRHTNSP
jgi:hypothetical protein